jgi:predicted transposase/invertase (TIGR01784 family)
VLEYLLEKGEISNLVIFFELINKEISPEVECNVMTGAEQLRMRCKLEGRLEGKREGKIEGKLEVAKHLLAQGLDVPFIARVTELSLDQIKELG